MELSLDRLSKQYDSKIAVDSISATLTPGVYGLLGANGAGKTTLMRMLCGILEPTLGEVLFNNHEIKTYRSNIYPTGISHGRRRIQSTPIHS